MGVIDTARAAADATPSPEAVKAAALNTCRDAVKMCSGRSVPEELGRLASACVSLPIGVAATGLKTCSQLLKPGEAICTAAKGLKDTCITTAEIITSPARFAGATVHTGVSAAKTGLRATKGAVKAVVSAPFKLPTQAIEVVGGGIAKVENMFAGVASSAPANDNAEKASDSPPPMERAA